MCIRDSVTIINEEERCGCMLLEKRIADQDGNLMMPSDGEAFCAIVESDMCTQKIELKDVYKRQYIRL